MSFEPITQQHLRGIYQIFTPRTMAVQGGEISVKHAAQTLGIPADAIYNWLRLGQVPANTRAGRWCIPWDPRVAGDLPAEGGQLVSAQTKAIVSGPGPDPLTLIDRDMTFYPARHACDTPCAVLMAKT
jgi:hypothetical protein